MGSVAYSDLRPDILVLFKLEISMGVSITCDTRTEGQSSFEILYIVYYINSTTVWYSIIDSKLTSISILCWWGILTYCCCRVGWLPLLKYL